MSVDVLTEITCSNLWVQSAALDVDGVSSPSLCPAECGDVVAGWVFGECTCHLRCVGLVARRALVGAWLTDSSTEMRTKLSLLRPADLQNTVRFHDLRHAHANWLMAVLSAKEVQERLGHASVTTTMDR